jgi:hypothetical protein
MYMWYTAFLDQGMPFPLGDLPLSALVSMCSSFARRPCPSALPADYFQSHYLSGPEFSFPGSISLFCLQLLPFCGAPELLLRFSSCSTIAVKRVCKVFSLRYQQTLPPVCC